MMKKRMTNDLLEQYSKYLYKEEKSNDKFISCGSKPFLRVPGLV